MFYRNKRQTMDGNCSMCYKYPPHVGILALELVVPSRCVYQDDLELYDGVSRGKYTIGLGQETMSFCTDREDVVSLCLTAVSNLMNRTKTSMKMVAMFVLLHKSSSWTLRCSLTIVVICF